MIAVNRHHKGRSGLMTAGVHITGLVVIWTSVSRLWSIRLLYGAIGKIMGPVIWGLVMLWGLLQASNKLISYSKRGFAQIPLAAQSGGFVLRTRGDCP